MKFWEIYICRWKTVKDETTAEWKEEGRQSSVSKHIKFEMSDKHLNDVMLDMES